MILLTHPKYTIPSPYGLSQSAFKIVDPTHNKKKEEGKDD